ncbi:MAG: hypothetical protein PHF76_12060, partial [Bacteroidales bacterium]|nr:hypothetical protein [Bacteroidales bacterium]
DVNAINTALGDCSTVAATSGTATSASTYADVNAINTALGDCSTVAATSGTATSASTYADVNAINTALGDCSGTSKFLAVKINNGSVQTITFDGNYLDADAFADRDTFIEFITLEGATLTVSDENNLVITTTSQGASSSVLITGDTADLFGTSVSVAGTATDTSKNKVLSISIDSGAAQTTTFDGNYLDADAFADRDTFIEFITLEGATLTVSDENNLVITTTSQGASSSVLITGDTANLFGTPEYVQGTSDTSPNRVLSISIDSDDAQTTTFDGNYLDADAFADWAAFIEFITLEGATLTASDESKLVITTTSQGASSSVLITGDTADLFGTPVSVAGTATDTSANKVLSISIDSGAAQTTTFDGNYLDADAFADRDTFIEFITLEGATLTVSDENNLVITTTSQGASSSVLITGDTANLFGIPVYVQGTDDGNTTLNKILSISVDGGETETKTFDANYLDDEGAFESLDAFLTAIDFNGAIETASGANIKITSSSTGIDSNVTIITDDAKIFGTPFEIHGFDDSYSLSEGWNLISTAAFIDTEHSVFYDGTPTTMYTHSATDGYLTKTLDTFKDALKPVDAMYIKTDNAETVLGIILAEESSTNPNPDDQKSLKVGWNLISVPQNIHDEDINDAFAHLIRGTNEGLTTVYDWYSSSLITDWTDNVDYTKGYWVHMNEDKTHSLPVVQSLPV